MSKFMMLLLMVVFAILTSCGSSSDAESSVDDALSQAEEDAKNQIAEQTQALLTKVPTLDGNYTGKTITSTENLDVNVDITGTSLKFDLSDGASSFPIEGTILVAVSSLGKKLASSGKIDVDYTIKTSAYWGFKDGDTVKGILELNGDSLKIDFNWTSNGTRPSNFTESDWSCTATRDQ